MRQRREIPPGIEVPGAEGDALRARIGEAAYALDVSNSAAPD